MGEPHVDQSSRRPLGRTGLNLAPVGFGAFKIGRNEATKYECSYDLPDDAACQALLDEVLEMGINLIDTAPAYGTSEERIGRLLGGRRDSFTLSTKVGETFEGGVGRFDFSSIAIDQSITRSLGRLRTDRLDLVFVHSDGGDQEIIDEGEVLETLARRREQGDLRFIGFSGKTVEGHLSAIRTGLIDCLMVEYHALDDSQGEVINAAEAAGIGVVVKKGLASGQLDPATAIPHCLRPTGVASVVIGSLTASHLRTNLTIAREAIAGT
jgi:aryl-alcohol dehydrogenase-like predicted oxidoreductase